MKERLTATDAPLRVDAGNVTANPHSGRNQVLRFCWGICYALFYRPSPRAAHKFRVFLLRSFGADVHWTAHPYPKCKIWAPWNLRMAKNSCLADDVDCYNPSLVEIGELAIVSQYAYLCCASHDYNHPDFTFFSRPIIIERLAWVAARAYVGPAVTVHEGAVVGANSCVYRDVPAWVVVGGNPATKLAERRPLTL